VCTCVDVKELRQAKMQLWTHDRCSQPRVWGRSIRNDSQLCAGYTSGFISACNVNNSSLYLSAPAFLSDSWVTFCKELMLKGQRVRSIIVNLTEVDDINN